MTLKEVSNGPDWVIWIVFIIFAVLTVILLTGHGANLIAGYNTSSKEEKNKYNKKKLSRVMGVGMLVITAFILVMAIGEEVLPVTVAYVFGAIIVIDIGITMILINTICKN